MTKSASLPKETPALATPPDAAAAEVDALGSRLAEVKSRIAQVIFGQEQVVEETLITLLAGGHALLIGVPGLAKTRLVETLGTVMGLAEKRVQFTPDLMPADITGSEVLEESEDGKRSFRFIKGPVFCQLLMADEINRASPRTQSALLQAMQEKEVSVSGHRHPLPHPFHVLATQNPLEQEGTYPLPEAQLDRFLLQIDVTYPELAAERDMLQATTGSTETTASEVMTAKEFEEAQRLVRRIPVGDKVILLCNSISCWIKGCDNLQQRIAEELGVELGETTSDNRYTLLPVTCLGACDKAPVMMVGDELHEDLCEESIIRILGGSTTP